MGLLDEAIREHLDLQRRRGADPTEVERAEREALGPVRRAPESAPGADDEVHDPQGFEPEPLEAEPEAFEPEPESEPAAYEPESYEPATQVARPQEAGPAFDQEADSWSYEDSQLEPGAAAPPPAHAEPPLSEPPPESRTAEPPPDERPPYERPLGETEEDVFGDPPPQARPHVAPTAVGGETQEYDVEAALNSESKRQGAEGEDVLEETPEFLQDTPDHDRLWFEQRPPKDFDFDG
ncbi:MAG: hypothetical protein WCB67_01160 [Solirubrobacteraceae bacterium]